MVNKPYDEIIDSLIKLKGSHVHDLLLMLIDAELSRLRKEMDDADVQEFKSNQGGIRLLKKIKSDLNPTIAMGGKDGAYL